MAESRSWSSIIKEKAGFTPLSSPAPETVGAPTN